MASGGVAGIEDIQTLMDEPVEFYGVITGRAIYEGRLDFAEANKLTLAKGAQ